MTAARPTRWAVATATIRFSRITTTAPSMARRGNDSIYAMVATNPYRVATTTTRFSPIAATAPSTPARQRLDLCQWRQPIRLGRRRQRHHRQPIRPSHGRRRRRRRPVPGCLVVQQNGANVLSGGLGQDTYVLNSTQFVGGSARNSRKPAMPTRSPISPPVGAAMSSISPRFSAASRLVPASRSTSPS